MEAKHVVNAVNKRLSYSQTFNAGLKQIFAQRGGKPDVMFPFGNNANWRHRVDS